MATIVKKMYSYDLNGKKLSFADWISNISPTETPFSSMTGKESISQTKFQWQTDVLPKIDPANAVAEGSKPVDADLFSTKMLENYTQIFRRGVSVSDTANVVQYYGRGQEVGYQMEKASLELKRDMEKAFLWQRLGEARTSAKAGHTAGFVGMVSTDHATKPTAGTDEGWQTLDQISKIADNTKKAAYHDPDTDAVVAFKAAGNTTRGEDLIESDIFQMTYNLYLSNSKANIIMFHPKYAAFFGSLIPGDGANITGTRLKMFGSMDDKYNAEVDTIIDPLGQRFALVPNRWMPEGLIYFFNPSDWTQMILRAPKKIQLAKTGSSQEWMIETELGLRHRNPYASGVLKVG